MGRHRNGARLRAPGGWPARSAGARRAARSQLPGRNQAARIRRSGPPSRAGGLPSRRGARPRRSSLRHAVLHQPQELSGCRGRIRRCAVPPRRLLPRARQQRPVLCVVRRISGLARLHRRRAQSLPRQHLGLHDRLPRQQALAAPARCRSHHQFPVERSVLGQVHRPGPDRRRRPFARRLHRAVDRRREGRPRQVPGLPARVAQQRHGVRNICAASCPSTPALRSWCRTGGSKPCSPWRPASSKPSAWMRPACGS